MTTSSQVNNKASDIRFAAISMALAVCLGALSAHALKGHLPAEQLSSFKTGVLYQLLHSLSILILVVLPVAGYAVGPWVSRLFKLGIVLFSGSIYVLATLPIHELDFLRMLGPVTPLGGLCFIIGWGIIPFSLTKSK